MSAPEIVDKVWNYAHVLRDNGVAYSDYVEQLEVTLEEFRSVKEALVIE